MLIGLIGVGKMGRAICERLMETGNQLVVWNRSPEKIADLKGVTIASTPAEVAALFRVDPKTVTRWAKAGKLTSIRTLGGHRRYRESEVQQLLKATQQK